MLPFILALVLAVGLPLLPSRLYHVLHLPTLKFNFLSARYAPDDPLVSSRETTLLIEGSYSNEINPDSGGSSQYLVFPDISGPACSDDATAAASYMSLLGEQDYSQPSIWRFIHVHLLYQLAEATVIIALSFVAAATFLPRRYLYTFVERLCTALFISRQYSPKVAFSSFLQDVFCGLHKYWMDNSVAKSPAGNSAAEASRYNLDFVPLDKANLTDLACICLPHAATHFLCSETNVAEQERSEDIPGTLDKCHPSPTTQLTVTTPNRNLGIPDAETSSHPTNLPRTIESPGPSTNSSSPVPSCTASLLSISMKDLYNSTRFAAASILLPESTPKAQEASTSDPFACPSSSCDRDPLRCITDASRHSESERKSGTSSGISQGSRRRHKSDGVRVHAVRYHLGDTAAPLAPVKVNVPRPSLESALESSNGSVRAREKELPASGTLPGNWAAPRIRGNRREKAECSPSSPDTALAGIVVTPQGELIVPASQRPDGRYLIHSVHRVWLNHTSSQRAQRDQNPPWTFPARTACRKVPPASSSENVDMGPSLARVLGITSFIPTPPRFPATHDTEKYAPTPFSTSQQLPSSSIRQLAQVKFWPDSDSRRNAASERGQVATSCGRNRRNGVAAEGLTPKTLYATNHLGTADDNHDYPSNGGCEQSRCCNPARG
jgi:hypothetical protein